MKRLTTLLLLVIGAGGCASTQVVESWRKPEFEKRAFTKIMVVAITPDDMNRILFEETFKERLEAKGFTAQISRKILPDGAATMDKDALRQLIIDGGFDGVLTASLQGVSYKPRGYEGGGRRTPPVGYNSFDHYFPLAYETVRKEGAFGTKEKVYLESQFYTIGQQGLVWRAVTETKNPDMIVDFAEDYGRVLINRLLKDGILASKK